MSADDAAYLHASQRLGERYGLYLSRAAYEALCQQLTERRDVIDRVQLGWEVVRVRVDGTQTICIYCPASTRVITFLSGGMYAVRDSGRQKEHARKHERRPQPYKRRGKQRRNEA